MVWYDAIRKNPIYKAIKKTGNNFMVLDDYGANEAWKSAIRQRKYIFDNILEAYQPPELEEDNPEEEDTSDSDNEEPPDKKRKTDIA